METPKSFEKLIKSLKKLPGVGRKSAEKMAFQILDLKDEDKNELSENLNNVLTNIDKCPVCGMMSENGVCPICSDTNRDKSQICVVENIRDVFAIERTGAYKGLYHVIGGCISPMKGIMPEDLNIDSLKERINDDVKEIILANSTSIEGETTTLFIQKILSKYNVSLSRIGYGIPMGLQLDYADEYTLTKALESRQKI